MPSNARKRLDDGLKELDDLENLIQLLTGGQRGPKSGIVAGRKAAVLLLNAHFEAFLEEILQEALKVINDGLNSDSLARDFTTPRANNIDRFFLILGIKQISLQPSWQKASNKLVRKNIDALQDARNAIAHGDKNARAKKSDVTRFRKYVVGFADSIDQLVSDQVGRLMNTAPPRGSHVNKRPGSA